MPIRCFNTTHFAGRCLAPPPGSSPFGPNAGRFEGRGQFRTVAPRFILRQTAGFTLLELVLATFISSLVVGIMAVSLNLSLRVWERQQSRPHNHMPQIVDLLKWQLATFDATPIAISDDTKTLFQGTEHSLAFATSHSVKALSGGVPVVVRYTYLPGPKKLFYAEVPLNPHHPDFIREFLLLKPEKPPSWPRFIALDVAQFSLAYRAEDAEQFTTSWESDGTLPEAVLIRFNQQDGQAPSFNLITPNFFFPPSKEESASEGDFDTSRKGLRSNQ